MNCHHIKHQRTNTQNAHYTYCEFLRAKATLKQNDRSAFRPSISGRVVSGIISSFRRELTLFIFVKVLTVCLVGEFAESATNGRTSNGKASERLYGEGFDANMQNFAVRTCKIIVGACGGVKSNIDDVDRTKVLL